MKAFWNVLFGQVVAMILLADRRSTTSHLLHVCEDGHIVFNRLEKCVLFIVTSYVLCNLNQ